MPYSMTGFGAGEGRVNTGRLRVEIRTVNHRFFNLSPKLPGDLAPLEQELRERLRRDIDRGHVSVQIRWVEAPEREAGLALNLERARAVVARLRELQTALGVAGEVTLDMVARQPDVMTAGPAEGEPTSWTDVEPVVVEALSECKAMRRREGEALVAELRHRLELLEQGRQAIQARAPTRMVQERDRLRAALAELLNGTPVDDGRVAHELALAADRLDITEELVRLGAHVAACREALSADRPVGKQLGFLAQELGREINTIGAKANDAEITHQVIAMKGELERFREQLENLE